MKATIKTMLLLGAVFATGVFAAEKKPVFSTTIDYLDYVFFEKETKDMPYYPLEVYEKRIREMAEGGIKKIYLRVNICGLTHYPSKVSALYGENGAFHWESNLVAGALRLIETYKHYNPCTETIRLGKKYGMEVWAWESLFDDAGVIYDEMKCPPEYVELYRRHEGWPLLDPFYRDNMDALAQRDPRHVPSVEELERNNREARKNPIAKITFTNHSRYKNPITLEAKDIRILTSVDNREWKPVETPFVFTPSVTADGFNRFEITGLEITDPYVKLVGSKPFGSRQFSVVLLNQRGQGEIFDNTGRKVSSVWSWLEADGDKGSLQFDRFQGNAAWDWGNRQMGFIVGEPQPQRWYYGVAEFNVPKAMKHKVDRFRELAEYPFDGFMFNIRCHSTTDSPEQYGYNPEVREIYKARYGKDIWKDDVDVDKLFEIRAEGIADFFKNCKAISGGRPIYMSGPPPVGSNTHDYGDMFGPLPWLYKRYFADGSIDGVIMIVRSKEDFLDYFTDEITGGKPVKFGVFREMGYYPQHSEMVIEDIRNLKKRNDLDEVELYETMILSHYPKIYDVIKE